MFGFTVNFTNKSQIIDHFITSFFLVLSGPLSTLVRSLSPSVYTSTGICLVQDSLESVSRDDHVFTIQNHYLIKSVREASTVRYTIYL